MKKRILIIGGSSYIGLNLCNFLAEKNSIYITYNKSVIKPAHSISLKADLLAEKPFIELEQEEPFDCVIWCAQSDKYSQASEDYKNLLEVNVMGLQKALDFCKHNKAKKFIYLSSGTVYKNKYNKLLRENSEINYDSHYGFSKYTAERICQHYSKLFGIKTIILRLFSVYGKDQKNKVVPRLRDKIINHELITLNNGIGMYFSPLYIKDLLNIIRIFLDTIFESEYEVFNVASSEIVTLKQVCHLIAETENKKLLIEEPDLEPVYSTADISKLKRVLGSFTFTPIKSALRALSEVEYR